MKSIKMILMGVLVFGSTVAYAEKAILSSVHEEMVKDLKLNHIIKSFKGNNAEKLTDELASDITTRAISADSPAAMTINKLYGYHHCLIVAPVSQGLSYIDGARCHIGTYLRSTIITVLEGPNYGCQLTISNLTGQIVYLNPNYMIDYTPGGVIFRHEYNDSSVVTGADQIVFVYQ